MAQGAPHTPSNGSQANADAEKLKGKDKKERKTKKSSAIFVTELRTRLDTYFRIVVRNTRDLIPKMIGHFLVRAVQNKMQIELFKRLGEMRDAVTRGLGEPESIVQERKALNAQLETLRKGERVLTRDPEIANLIAATDDDLLCELRKERLEENMAKRDGLSHSGSSSIMKNEVPAPAPAPVVAKKADASPEHKEGKRASPVPAGASSLFPSAPSGKVSPPGTKNKNGKK